MSEAAEATYKGPGPVVFEETPRSIDSTHSNPIQFRPRTIWRC